tara:strand:- start:275 stop:568 length:294 start_codon:yes stop_codon:yes gene_type:complete
VGQHISSMVSARRLAEGDASLLCGVSAVSAAPQQVLVSVGLVSLVVSSLVSVLVSVRGVALEAQQLPALAELVSLTVSDLASEPQQASVLAGLASTL